jgi:hypothetical protein
MNLEEAKTLLNGATRHELRDHAFGDMEVYWVKNGKEIACGYFGGDHAEISVFKPAADATTFDGDDARALRECGTLGMAARNDETGPNEFIEGQTVPGLTLEGVREELTNG